MGQPGAASWKRTRIKGRTIKLAGRPRRSPPLRHPDSAIPLLFAIGGVILGFLILAIGLPLALDSPVYGGGKSTRITNLTCVMVSGVTILGASITGLYICLSSRRTP